jgi:hypothetical protein
VQKLSDFMQSHLSILSLSWWAAWVLLRESLPLSIPSSIFHVLSCTSFKVAGLILRSLIYFELVLVWLTGMGVVSVFCREIITSPSNICWRGCLFSIICFWHLCQKLGGHIFMDSYLGSLLCSTGLYICFCTSTMLFYCYGSLL